MQNPESRKMLGCPGKSLAWLDNGQRANRTRGESKAVGGQIMWPWQARDKHSKWKGAVCKVLNGVMTTDLF